MVSFSSKHKKKTNKAKNNERNKLNAINKKKTKHDLHKLGKQNKPHVFKRLTHFTPKKEFTTSFTITSGKFERKY